MHIGKRTACAIAATGLAVGLTSTAKADASQSDSLIVETTLGKIQGKTINNGKVRAFLGIPYAAPPVGNLRWKAPQPAAGWAGVRDATSFGSHCPQNVVFEDMIFPDPGPSENCLFLNVYAPANATPHSKLPVMFWIHGGAYIGGSASEPRHGGDHLPLKGVVLVTINYRVGVLGFLATPELAAESNGSAGNYGLMDMVAALQWVNANINRFGGNAENVTIFGESAGSFAVSTLMAAPSAKGLFHKAIGESGSAFSGMLALDTLDVRMKKGSEWMSSIGVKSLTDLRALPVEKLLETTRELGISGFPPAVDGKFIVEPLATTYSAGRQAHVPLLAGWNSDEGSFFAGMTADQWKSMAKMFFKKRTAEALKHYPADNDRQAARSAVDYGSDAFVAYSAWLWLEAHRETGKSSVYRYHFELAAPPSKFHPESFSFHSDEIEYVFGTLDTRPGAVWRAEDRKLSDQMMTYWTNFAKTGDPNGTGLPHWPKYGDHDELLHLDKDIHAAPDTLRERYEFLRGGFPVFQF
jgi:para-nitrobenzyl esterase